MSHLIDRLKHHASNKEYTAFARSTMTEAAMTIEQLEQQRDQMVKALGNIRDLVRIGGDSSDIYQTAQAALAAAKG
jgi:hypothetical protein